MKNTPLLVANNAVLAVSVRVWCSSRVYGVGLEIDRDFFPGSENEPDLVCADDGVVD